MDMNNIVAGVFMIVVAGVVVYNAYKQIMESKERRAEMKSIQNQINQLTEKLKSLSIFKG